MDNVEEIKKGAQIKRSKRWKQFRDYAKENPDLVFLCGIWGVVGVSFAGFLLYVGKSMHGYDVVQTSISTEDDLVVLKSLTKSGKEFITTYTKEAAKDVIKAAITAADTEVLREVADAIE